MRNMLAVLPVAVAILGLAACDDKPDETPPVRPVLSLVVEPETETVFGPFAGTVQPRYEAQLGFRTSGRMVSRGANVGDQVTKEVLLASLDPRIAELQMASSKADLTNAQAQLTNATATEKRQSTLLQSGSTAQSQVDSAVASKDTAEAKVNQAQAGLTKAQEQLGYTNLHSDFDGVITKWNVEVGQVVSEGQAAVTVARPDVRDAVFDVPDDLVAKAQPNTSFTVALAADPNVTANGVVREVAPQADAATRTRRIRLTLNEPPEVFRLGTTVTITLTESKPPTVLIPSGAVVDKDGKSAVWLVSQDNKAVMKPVALGDPRGNLVTVKEGVSKGDRVITAGVHSLSDGQPVKILEP